MYTVFCNFRKFMEKRKAEGKGEITVKLPLIVIDKKPILGHGGGLYVGLMFDLPLICRVPQFKSAT